MANFRISELPDTTVASYSDLYPVTQGSVGPDSGVTKKITPTLLFSLLVEPPAIGTTTPNAGKFTTLQSTGESKFGLASAAWWVVNGSATYPTATVDGALADIDAKVLGKGLGYLNTTKFFVGQPGVRGSIDTRTTVYMRTSTAYPGASSFSPWFAGGIFSGTVSSPVDGYFKFEMADTVAGGGSGVRLFQDLNTGATRGRTTLSVGLNIATIVSADPGDFHVAGGFIARARASFSGVPGFLLGNLFGGNNIVTATSGAGGHVNSLVSHEFDSTIASTTSVAYHAGVTSILHYDSVAATGHGSRGWIEDYAFGIGSAQNNLSTIGWRIGIALGSAVGWSMNADSRVIAAQPVAAAFAGTSRAYELADVVDMTDVTLNRAAMITKNMNIDGSGNGGFQVASGVALQARDGVLAKTAVVASVTPLQPDGGGLYSASGVPCLALDPPSSGYTGTAATANIAYLGADLTAPSIQTAGSGYAVGNVLTMSGGTFATAAQVTVREVTSSGGIVWAEVTQAGSYSVLPANPVSFTGGSGTLFTYNVNWGASAAIATHAAEEILSMTAGGSGYAVGQVLTQTGGTFVTAAQVTVVRVDGTGKVREARVSRAGEYSVLPVGEQTFTGGTGTGMTMALLYTALTNTVTVAGLHYTQYPPPVARYVGGTVFRPPVLVVAMTATQVPLLLNQGNAAQRSYASVTAAGLTQGTATPIVADMSLVSVPVVNNGVILPAGLQGMRKVVHLSDASVAGSLQIYPATGERVGDAGGGWLAVNTPYNLVNIGGVVDIMCVRDGWWAISVVLP